MVHFVILLIVVAGIAFYFMTPDERLRAFQFGKRNGSQIGRQIWKATTLHDLPPNPFLFALYSRTRWAVITPAICVLSAAIFMRMLFDPRPLASPDTLIAWGGNFWPRTINGEWWRLVSSSFVHSGMLQLLAEVIGLLQVGLIVERLVGPVAFASVYFTAAIVASFVSMFAAPGTVSVGATPAILAVYGLLIASTCWTLIRGSVLTIPLSVAQRIAPSVGFFILYGLATHRFGNVAALAGLATGLWGGLFFARDVSERKPVMSRLAGAMAACVFVFATYAVITRQKPVEVVDVQSEIQHVIAVETHTSRVYDKAVTGFRKGRLTVEALTDLIERTIIPEVRAASMRVDALKSVPAQDEQIVRVASDYLKLRDESWHMRAKALHAASTSGLHEADLKEEVSLEVFRKLDLRTFKATTGN